MKSLGYEWPRYLGYFVSFTFIGGVWIAHSNMTPFIKAADPALMRLNLMLLLFVSFLPCTTAIVATHLFVSFLPSPTSRSHIPACRQNAPRHIAGMKPSQGTAPASAAGRWLSLSC